MGAFSFVSKKREKFVQPAESGQLPGENSYRYSIKTTVFEMASARSAEHKMYKNIKTQHKYSKNLKIANFIFWRVNRKFLKIYRDKVNTLPVLCAQGAYHQIS